MPIKRHKPLIWITCLIAALSLPAQTVRSTVGFAEWQVYTPSGNLILHADGWKETYGDCLKADDADTAAPAERNKVYVSHPQKVRQTNL